MASAVHALQSTNAEIRRLRHIRNVGIFAHVDAGKTTVTERMLALAGVIHRPGSVDTGNTVTDYLPAERERGITIQSAAISFEWGWHNHYTGEDYDANDNVEVHLIDTPGHVDFSVEVNRSVAVLDGAVLVVDAVAGAQAQTETVWRAVTRPSINNHQVEQPRVPSNQDHGHEPLPCLAMINKMDKDGCNYFNAMESLRTKLPGANPISMQLPLFRQGGSTFSPPEDDDSNPLKNITTQSDAGTTAVGQFVGVVDLIHMRSVLWPDGSRIEDCIPTIQNLLKDNNDGTHEPVCPDCPVTQAAIEARKDCVAALAEIDESIEECFLMEEDPTNAELRAAFRRATLSRRALPVLAGAALKGKGVEPLLDAIADLLPSPLDRMPPALIHNGNEEELGHSLHSSLLALAFKVVHMKGRGGSGDGRVVFCRVYSGQIKARDTLRVVTPPAPGQPVEKARTERVGGLLELAGGRFDNVEDGLCASGDVCALVGLKSVVTGDTILLDDKKNKNQQQRELVYLAGVASPKPVLTVRLETDSAQEQARLSSALSLLAIEDPSLFVEETEAATLLSGLGELHIEVTLDRLLRENGIEVRTGAPAVAYRETVTDTIETNGLVEYDKTIGATRLQAAVHLCLEPVDLCRDESSSCTMLADPTVHLDHAARAFLGVDENATEEELAARYDVVNALIAGCRGALNRGCIGPHPMANVRCRVVGIGAEGGLPALQAMPGSLRAAAAHAVATLLSKHKGSDLVVLEPVMSMEVTVPDDMVGAVLSDWTSKRGTVGDVFAGGGVGTCEHAKALVRGEVPLVEILGYANRLRSLSGGEGAFTAEYKGHAPCDK